MPRLTPPALTNDCFAMPQGAHWTPVAKALAHLQANLAPVTAIETVPIAQSAGRILAADVIARRSHPPAPNAAVDGYGFAGPAAAGTQEMPLLQGRAAAGNPYEGEVPAGHAIRILTGANLPSGVDTVILQEDVAADANGIVFNGPLKAGANARKAGEDMRAGDVILRRGTRLTPRAVGTAIAAGIGDVETFAPLTVGVLSTGDELRQPGQPANDGDIFDANRPMLLAEVSSWGYLTRDLGCAPDNRTRLRDILTKAARDCDLILTSGGASGGDEDHMSALLQDTGSFALWRIAMKPGRPLAMGLWDGTPVLGLPGNPVAAFVCAQVFAAPACAILAGAEAHEPMRVTVPAGFTKSKKDGRTEYLRARLVDGKAEVFPSEGSGRISGLHWATGLVELPHEAANITPGDPVTFRPFSGIIG